MAHNLDFSTGKAAFASYKKEAWHKLGTVLENRPESIKEACEVSRTNYIVEKKPNIHRIGEHDIISKDSFFTYRTDVNKILGSHVGARYEIMQNTDAFAIAEPFIKDNRIAFETVGAIKDGSQAFICMKLNEPVRTGSNDVTEAYISIWNSFDGSKAITAFLSPVRVVCNNTLNLALKNAKNKISIRHTQNADVRLNEAMRILSTFTDSMETFGEAAKELKRQSWRERKYFDYLTNVFCTDKEIREMNTSRHPLEVLSTRKKNIITDVLEYADNGVGQREAESGTAWWAYNSITGYLNNAKKYKDEENRVDNLLFGGSAGVMAKALDLAVNDNKLIPLGVNLN